MGKLEKTNQEHEHIINLSNEKDWVSIPDVCGPSWWAILHNTVLAIKTDGCESCGGHAVKLMSFLHDMVNVDLNKKVYDPKNVLKFRNLTEKLFNQSEKQLGNGNRKMKAENSFPTNEKDIATGVLGFNNESSSVTPVAISCNTTMRTYE